MDAHSRLNNGSHMEPTPDYAELKREDVASQTRGALPAITTTMKRTFTAPTVSSLISPPEDSSESAHSSQPRQSLPSIHEALLSHPDVNHPPVHDRMNTYSSVSNTVQTPNSPNSAKRLRPHEASHHREVDHSSSQPASNNGYITNANYSNSSSYQQSQPPPPPTSMSSRNPGWRGSQAQSHDRVPYSYSSWEPSHVAQPDYVSRATGPSTPHHAYAQASAYAAPASTAVAPQYPPSHPQNWRNADQEEDFRFERTPRPQYGESVKRHLDDFDLDRSLNEMADAGTRIMKFTDHYRHQSYLTQRCGPTSMSTPAMIEVDDMSKQTNRIQESLAVLRSVVQARDAEMAERTKERQAEKARSFRHEEMAATNEDVKSAALLGSDAKKRRGRAAPPGRCHSCNRAETPEWRRGPDGARTLCNACGLHYAKLTRKAASKTSLASSSLRPKSLDPGSPSG